jgi:hypothetical protein
MSKMSLHLGLQVCAEFIEVCVTQARGIGWAHRLQAFQVYALQDRAWKLSKTNAIVIRILIDN